MLGIPECSSSLGRRARNVSFIPLSAPKSLGSVRGASFKETPCTNAEPRPVRKSLNCRQAVQRSSALAAMPFCHLELVACKPKNNSYLWKASHYPANPQHIGEQIKKRRFDLKMTAVECRKLLGV